jgi:PKHD-type hydroxylase
MIIETMRWNFPNTYLVPKEESWLTGRAENVFTPEECAKIIEIGKSKETFQAKLGDDTIREDIRDSKISWIEPDDAEWIYERIESYVCSVNERLFHFDITGFTEGLQFTEYSAPGGHYTAHIDRMNIGGNVRKLSITIQLSNPADYDGGELEILTSLECPEIASKDQGTAFFFNSMLLHRVKPVTRGTRYALVMWITGPRFK